MIPRIRKVLYTTDLSKNSAYAFRYAINTARQHDAKIQILHVIEALPPTAETFLLLNLGKKKVAQTRQGLKEELRKKIEERIAKFAEIELKDEPETLKRIVGIHVVYGDPVSEILSKTDELGCDTIIMGTHGKGSVTHTFLGSVAEKVLRRIRKPVYIIPLPTGDTDISFKEI